MAGYRGGYGPFRDAVKILSERGEFNPAEVSNVDVDVVDKLTSRRDETIIPFPEGVHICCEFKALDVSGRFAISLDCDEGLYVETFEVEELREEFGICELRIAGGEIELSTTVDAGPYRRARKFKARRSSGALVPRQAIRGSACASQVCTSDREDRQPVQHIKANPLPEAGPTGERGYVRSRGPIQVPEIGTPTRQRRRSSTGHGDDRSHRIWGRERGVSNSRVEPMPRQARNLSRTGLAASQRDSGDSAERKRIKLQTPTAIDRAQPILRWKCDCKVPW